MILKQKKNRNPKTYQTDLDSIYSDTENSQPTKSSKPPLAKRKSKNVFPIEHYYKKNMSKENVMICLECEIIDPNNYVKISLKCYLKFIIFL